MMRKAYLCGTGLLAGLAVAGCSSTAPEPQDMARTTVQTAPADLQLTCASAAATSAGVEADKVLPVGSSQLDATRYQVDLNASGQRYVCVVDNVGNVTSVQKAA
ncbi:hypothetical protein EDC40_105420 [Aminobacter aminovorans]|uniref:Lipoprotein n=2 Tax=Aminobacter aminovorans TaxID=83263 RepID=A0A380WM93_AMIAI|nr:hypothetical protein EDC40_105420 [Aminobacter aminovorans]SUU90123.1 Uncharacterised protein [Aminobacter aminovorans]